MHAQALYIAIPCLKKFKWKALYNIRRLTLSVQVKLSRQIARAINDQTRDVS
jgi:hypothetical protein